jgi:hypothetical protein
MHFVPVLFLEAGQCSGAEKLGVIRMGQDLEDDFVHGGSPVMFLSLAA